MKQNKQELKNGINIHMIKTDIFKTDLVAVYLTTKLTRENVTKNGILPMVLKKGSSEYENMEEINKNLEELYGAGFDCGIDKIGDNQVLKFYVETINEEYLPQKEDILKKGLDILFNIIFAPKIQNDSFMKEYIDTSKEKLKIVIEGKKDNKERYAALRCQEEMFEGTPFGLYKYGYIEDIDKIDEKNLYEHYKKLISECKIDIFISGNIDENKIVDLINENKDIKNLTAREADYNQKDIKAQNHNEKVTIENLDVTQGNLMLGLSIDENTKEEKYVAMLYNAILGGSANSKMFQVVREKNSLAYTAASSFLRPKNSIFIKCGIEIDNYEKTLNLIKEQIEDMKNGKFEESELENAKVGILSAIKMIPEEQDTAITYFMGQELAEHKMEYDEYEKNIKKVTKEDIVNLAGKVKIDTIYFLRKEG